VKFPNKIITNFRCKPLRFTLETSAGAETIKLDEEFSVRRTNAARIVIDDRGLSRLNTMFFRGEYSVFVVDENSISGTFVGGERISGQPRQIFEGDTIKIGTEMLIRVEIGQSSNIIYSYLSAAENNQRRTAENEQRTKPRFTNAGKHRIFTGWFFPQNNSLPFIFTKSFSLFNLKPNPFGRFTVI